jgi:cytoskeletal protein CcmA (bactofilin family)
MGAVKLGLVAALVLAALAPGAALARPTPAAAGADAGRTVVRGGEFAELAGPGSDMAFVSGEQARITAQVADDIFAAGRELRVEGAQADHLILAGGELELAPAAVHDILAAGGRIRLSAGAVRDDVVAVGGEISLDPGARIEGSAVLAGGRLRLAAPVGGEVMARGARIELDGPVARDARLEADEIVIGPQARVGGDLYVRGARIQIAPGAVIQGRTVREVVAPRQRGSAAGLALMATLAAFGVLVMVAVVAAAAPRLEASVDQRLRSRFWPTIGIGALILLLGPPVVLALLAAVLGAPLAVLLALAYLVAVPLAFTGVCYWIGQHIRGRLAKAGAAAPPRWPARVGWTTLAALLLIIACMIPIVGGLIWLAALATGMGAVAAYATRDQFGPAPAEAS